MRRLLTIIILSMFILCACSTGKAGYVPPTTKSLPLEITGTLADGTKIESSQVGFRLRPELNIKNLGKETWNDPDAVIRFIITDPKGIRTYYATSMEQYLRQNPEKTITLDPKESKSFQFSIDYVMKMKGTYNIFVEVESISTFGYTLIARSALTIDVIDPDSKYEILPKTCGPYIECQGIEICCSKGVDVVLKDVIGHCAVKCEQDEMIVPYVGEY